jgi:hypothetical protein
MIEFLLSVGVLASLLVFGVWISWVRLRDKVRANERLIGRLHIEMEEISRNVGRRA